MSKHVKTNRNFIASVDGYRRPSRKRSTAGAYQVGAKNEKEAAELVKKAIGFGSVKIVRELPDRVLAHGEVKRCVFVGGEKPHYEFAEARHATAPQEG